MPQKCTVPRTCQQCGTTFLARPALVQGDKPRFCSRPCFFLSMRVERIARTCETCGVSFDVLPNRLDAGVRFCSVACHNVAKSGVGKPLMERFARFVDQRGPDECWPWTGSIDARGYGQINGGDGKPLKAHRIALEQRLGCPLTSSEMALHHCDNRPCVNGAHLYPGDASDNVRDMHERGRARSRGLPGSENPKAKLTEEAVRHIRQEARRGVRGTQLKLARQHGVSQSVISKIVLGQMWRHVS